jgi:glycosyltransferase involved in cell wall biosynthesis
MHKNTQNKKSLTLGLPCFNEENNIQKVIFNCVKILIKNFNNWELIIVDNKSTDSTIIKINKIIASFKKKVKKKIKLVQNKENINYSGSTEKIINSSKYEYVCILDSDNQYAPSDIIKLYNYAYKNNIDLLIGNRHDRKDSFFRIIVTIFLNKISKIFIGSIVSDINCGIKLIKKIGKIKLIRINSANPELLCVYKRENKKIAEIKVKHYHRKTGDSVNTFKNIFFSVIKYLRYLLKIKKKYHKY